MSTYSIHRCKFQSGERFPVLRNTATGLPLTFPTLFTLNELRMKGNSSKTIEACLRAILHLLVWAETKEIDIEVRCREGILLSDSEIHALIDACKKPLECLRQLRKMEAEKSSNVLRLKRRNRVLSHNVSKHTACIRILYIHRYLKWRTTALLEGLSPTHPQYLVNFEKRKMFLQSLHSKIPTASRRSQLEREGLDKQSLLILIGSINVNSSENPWGHLNTRVRNRLIVRMLLDLGVRRGELLGIEIRDVDFRKNELTIHRTPDNKRDPRIDEPNTKTLARILPIGESLAADLHYYITKVRNKSKGARVHSFLFTAINTGEPLSFAAISKLFSTLRKKVEGLSTDLSAHVLRHTWNELFSEKVDENNTPEAEEQKLRSYLMGWKENSGTAAIYLKRKIRKDAQKASIEYQQKMAKLHEKS